MSAATAAGLPRELGEVVLLVTRRSRLWKSEQVEVARELCAHFEGGLSEGTTPEVLRARFGDPANAAALISRAKRRSRPWFWHVARRTMHVSGGLMLLIVAWYGWNVARFYWSAPLLTLNVQAEINARATAVPLGERGWPHYRDAYRAMNRSGVATALSKLDSWPWIAPGTPAWNQACAAVDAHRTAMDLIYVGASKQRGAYVLSAVMPVDAASDPAVRPFVPDGVNANPEENPLGVGMLLPNVGVYRHHARFLAFEAHRAAHEKDGRRVVKAVSAMLSVARHSAEDGSIVSQLVSLAIGQLAVETVGRVTTDLPECLNDGDLVDLVHLLSAHSPRGDGRWTIDYSVERRNFDDLLQRFFTDDGNGDGRLCKGLLAYDQEMGVNTAPGSKWVAPALGGVVAGRKAHRDRYNEVIDQFELLGARPLFVRDYTAIDRQLTQMRSLSNVRFSLVALMAPALQRTQTKADIAKASRDGVTAGLCILLHQRRTGRFAQSWDELVPVYLPVAPTDPWSGAPMGLAVEPGRPPAVYSVGINRRDDHGVVGAPWRPYAAQSELTATVPVGQTHPQGHVETLDWVIWPRIEPTHGGPRGPVHKAPLEPAVQTTPSAFEWGWLGSLVGSGH